MRRNTLVFAMLVVFMVAFQIGHSQSLITGRVVDKETGKYLGDVSIVKVGSDFKTTTNAMGFFQLEVSGSTKLELSSKDYVTAQIEISGKGNVRIELIRKHFSVRVQEPPSFPGGIPALHEYIRKNMRVPRGTPSGIVRVQIKIDSTGSVIKDSVKIIQSLNKACDWEALRVMKKSPKWIPGDDTNLPIVVPIKFN